MAVRIGINGFGRIGRCVLRAWRKDAERAGFEFVAVNDLTDPPTLAHLLKYDSVHGRFDGSVSLDGSHLVVDDQRLLVTAEKDPAKLKWKEHGVDIVLECTGVITDGPKARTHIDAGGAKKVLISAPAKGPDVTLAVGINLDAYDPARHHVLSNASCTTNCLAPVAKVLLDSFGIVHGMMTTIHSYTNDQRILDLPHKDLRRARAAALSMIPTTTGAAKALSEVIPALKGKLDGYAMRVPTPNVSVVDFTARLEKPFTVEAVNEAYRQAAADPRYMGVLAVTTEPLVSTDLNGDTHSATVDLLSTQQVGDMVKVLAWYDNEMGYATRLYELAKFVAQKGLGQGSAA
ncbi:MAG: type I glyceraldehyde-3-phosphate dehydrogenase [Polyangia bacterium]